MTGVQTCALPICYKEHTNGANKNDLDRILEQFRALVEVNDIEKNMSFFTNIKDELKRNEIYVYTPKGDIIELPSGATPIDFAYKIHSEVGNTTTGALVNNKMVKIDYELQDGDLVELITKKGHTPSRGWLKIVKTEAAKSRIKSFFYKKEREKYISLGHEMMLNECKKKNIDINDVFSEENVKKLCEMLSMDSLDDIYFSKLLTYIKEKTESEEEITETLSSETAYSEYRSRFSEGLCNAELCNIEYADKLTEYSELSPFTLRGMPSVSENIYPAVSSDN